MSGDVEQEPRVLTYKDVKTEKQLAELVIVPELKPHPPLEKGRTFAEEYHLQERQVVAGVFMVKDILPEGVISDAFVRSRALFWVKIKLNKRLVEEEGSQRGEVYLVDIKLPDPKNPERPANQQGMAVLFTPFDQE